MRAIYASFSMLFPERKYLSANFHTHPNNVESSSTCWERHECHAMTSSKRVRYTRGVHRQVSCSCSFSLPSVTRTFASIMSTLKQRVLTGSKVTIQHRARVCEDKINFLTANRRHHRHHHHNYHLFNESRTFTSWVRDSTCLTC